MGSPRRPLSQSSTSTRRSPKGFTAQGCSLKFNLRRVQQLRRNGRWWKCRARSKATPQNHRKLLGACSNARCAPAIWVVVPAVAGHCDGGILIYTPACSGLVPTQDSIQLTVGYHRMEGKMVKLKKPMVLMQKVLSADGGPPRYEVRCGTPPEGFCGGGRRGGREGARHPVLLDDHEENACTRCTVLTSETCAHVRRLRPCACGGVSCMDAWCTHRHGHGHGVCAPCTMWWQGQGVAAHVTCALIGA